MKRLLPACVVLAAVSACAPAARQARLSTAPAIPEPAAANAGASRGPAPSPRHKGGADLAIGVYGREDDDLVVNTTMPLVLRRTYNSGDGHTRQFGLDWTHAGEWWLRGDDDPRIPWADLILPNGARIHFERISPGDSQEDAILRHDSTPTEFNGALLSWTGTLWEMRFVDGATARFLDCNSEAVTCSLVERTDADGNRIVYIRDPAGSLLKMESEGQSISFEYDERKRVVRAWDAPHHDVSYHYDEHGMLRRVTSPDGVVREYDYDSEGHLTSIREPDRIISNWYDESGRWIRQVLKDSDDDPEPYVARVDYVVDNESITGTAFDEGGGLEVTRYDEGHYVVSEMLDAAGAAPIVFSYARDAVSNAITGATMSCVGDTTRVTRLVPLSTYGDASLKANLIRAFCVPGPVPGVTHP